MEDRINIIGRRPDWNPGIRHRLRGSPIIAGLVAEGVTEVDNIHFIDRGYERIESKLAGLKADIKRLDDGQGLLKAVSSNILRIK